MIPLSEHDLSTSLRRTSAEPSLSVRGGSSERDELFSLSLSPAPAQLGSATTSLSPPLSPARSYAQTMPIPSLREVTAHADIASASNTLGSFYPPITTPPATESSTATATAGHPPRRRALSRVNELKREVRTLTRQLADAMELLGEWEEHRAVCPLADETALSPRTQLPRVYVPPTRSSGSRVSPTAQTVAARPVTNTWGAASLRDRDRDTVAKATNARASPRRPYGSVRGNSSGDMSPRTVAAIASGTVVVSGGRRRSRSLSVGLGTALIAQRSERERDRERERNDRDRDRDRGSSTNVLRHSAASGDSNSSGTSAPTSSLSAVSSSPSAPLTMFGSPARRSSADLRVDPMAPLTESRQVRAPRDRDRSDKMGVIASALTEQRGRDGDRNPLRRRRFSAGNPAPNTELLAELIKGIDEDSESEKKKRDGSGAGQTNIAFASGRTVVHRGALSPRSKKKGSGEWTRG